jgi:DNA-binding transcriptional MerR regulator
MRSAAARRPTPARDGNSAGLTDSISSRTTTDDSPAVSDVWAEALREPRGRLRWVHDCVHQQPTPQPTSHASPCGWACYRSHNRYATICSRINCKQIEGTVTEFRLDELARRADVASTTVRLYQTKGLLAPPRLVGRTGWYDESHLSRLRLIARLQADGHSLAGIARLLQQWEKGRSLDAVVGVESELDALLVGSTPVELEPSELLGHFADGSMTPELLQRATDLGLIALTDDGRIRVADRRFVDTGSSLARLGVPLAVILDEWEALLVHTDDLAQRFIALFEEHVATKGWREELESGDAATLAASLAQLRVTARTVVSTALDTSLARIGRERLGDLVDAGDS